MKVPFVDLAGQYQPIRDDLGVGNRPFRGIQDCFAMSGYRRRAVPGRRAAKLASEAGPVPRSAGSA